MRTIILLGFLVLAAIAFVACGASVDTARRIEQLEQDAKRVDNDREYDSERDPVNLKARIDDLEQRIKVLELLESNKVRP